MSTSLSPRHNRLKGGFTLLELILALGIFAIIAVGIFGVLDASMRTTQELYDAQRVTRQIGAFAELCRTTFSTLPATASFRVPPSEEAEGQEVVFSDAPSIFAWGGNPLNYGTTTLAVRPQEDGHFNLSISRSDFAPPKEEGVFSEPSDSDPSLEPDDQGRYWLMLVADLEWARWRFFDPRLKEWVESWVQDTRPPLVELSLLLPGDTVPFRAVFPVAATEENSQATPTWRRRR